MNNSRRQFFKYTAGFAAIAATFRWFESLAADAKLKLVEVGKGMALSIKYVDDKKKTSDKSLMADRQGVKWADQYCSNCMLYTKHGMEGGKEVGKCTLFPNEYVIGKGWCQSWSKKA